jgi:predicted adenylyl cyclase CyaB
LSQKIVSEWLRIRETNKECTFNFKQWLPIGAEIQNQCNEYETVIKDAYALKKTLLLLDFREIIVVNKKRNSWIYENVEISIDCVDNLGDFIELEALNVLEESDIERTHRQFDVILETIKAKIGKRDHRGYPYMLLAKTCQGVL